MNLNAAIVPYFSIGDVNLYTPISDLQELLEKNEFKYEMYSRFLVKYVLEDTLEIHFNIINGKVYKICALKKYGGDYIGIKVGSNLTKLSSKLTNLTYNDFEEFFELNGVVIETVLEKDEQTKEWEDVVSSFSVYIKEIDSNDPESVQKVDFGKW